jgi:hypothetical protein
MPGDSIKFHMIHQVTDDGTLRLVLTISNLASVEEMTDVALWVRDSLNQNLYKLDREARNEMLTMGSPVQ